MLSVFRQKDGRSVLMLDTAWLWTDNIVLNARIFARDGQY